MKFLQPTTYRVPPKPRAKGDNLQPRTGFTIIETLVATFLLGVTTVAITGLVVAGLRSSIENKQQTVALGVANEEMEVIRSLPYGDVGYLDPLGIEPDGVLKRDRWVERNNEPYRVRLAIELEDDEANGFLLPGTLSEQTADYKSATVSVAWPGPNQNWRNVTITSFITDTALRCEPGDPNGCPAAPSCPDPSPDPDGSPAPSASPTGSPEPSPDNSPLPSPETSPKFSPDPSASPSPQSSPAPSPLPDRQPCPASGICPAVGGPQPSCPPGALFCPPPSSQQAVCLPSPTPSLSPSPTPSPSPSPTPSPSPDPCDDDDDCTDPQRCDHDTGTCSEPCDPEDPVCPDGGQCDPSDGLCVPPSPPPPPPCTEDTDCSGNDVCDPETGQCVPPTCDSNVDCEGIEFCDPVTNSCVPQPCTNDSQCAPGDECNPTTNTCEVPTPDPCTDDSDCGGGQQCNPTTNECGDPCAVDAECSGGDLCDPGSGTCIDPDPNPSLNPSPEPCSDNSQCGGGQECINGNCDPPWCPDPNVPVECVPGVNDPGCPFPCMTGRYVITTHPEESVENTDLQCSTEVFNICPITAEWVACPGASDPNCSYECSNGVDDDGDQQIDCDDLGCWSTSGASTTCCSDADCQDDETGIGGSCINNHCQICFETHSEGDPIPPPPGFSCPPTPEPTTTLIPAETPLSCSGGAGAGSPCDANGDEPGTGCGVCHALGGCYNVCEPFGFECINDQCQSPNTQEPQVLTLPLHEVS